MAGGGGLMPRQAFIAFTMIMEKIPLIDDKEFRFLMRDLLQSQAKKAVAKANLTTTTWASRPRFTINLRRGRALGSTIGIEIETDSDVWFWLDRGTRVRYASMTSNYIPKTRVDMFYSFTGVGHKTITDTSAPNPGIEARHWSVLLEEEFSNEIYNQMTRVMNAIAAGRGREFGGVTRVSGVHVIGPHLQERKPSFMEKVTRRYIP